MTNVVNFIEYGRHNAQVMRSTYSIRLHRPRRFYVSGMAISAIVVDGVAGVMWNAPVIIGQYATVTNCQFNDSYLTVSRNYKFVRLFLFSFQFIQTFRPEQHICVSYNTDLIYLLLK